MLLERVPPGTVVVGVDDSDASGLALLWAIDQARAEGRAVTVVHAIGPVGAIWMDQDGRDTRAGVTGTNPRLQEGRRILDLACDEVRRRAPGLVVHDVLRVADPRDVLLALAERARIVVVGSHGRGPVRSLLLGSVSVAVVRHTACPVVVLRPDHPNVERAGILVGVDASVRSAQILRFAYHQASSRRSPLTVLHTFPASRVGNATTPGTGPEAEERLLVAEVVSGLQEEFPDVSVRVEVVGGVPGDRLVEESAGMDLVVVGSPAGGAASELLFGSVASYVVEHAACPVAVVPVGDPA